MSVTLSGLLALENRQTVDGLPLSLAFDGQMWLADERSLRGSLRYYNATKESLPDMGTFFAWIHVRLQSFQNQQFVYRFQVAKYNPSLLRPPKGGGGEPPLKRQATEVEVEKMLSNETDTQTTSPSKSFSSSTDTMDNNSDVHVVGNILHVRPFSIPRLRLIYDYS
jgi:hypothetical protein